jgi:hypothetical protein
VLARADALTEACEADFLVALAEHERERLRDLLQQPGLGRGD